MSLSKIVFNSQPPIKVVSFGLNVILLNRPLLQNIQS